MRRAILIAAFCGLNVGIAGCADPNTKPTRIEFGTTTDTVTMGPALRLVSERPRALEDGQWLPTMCSEPSPDVAVAFGRSIAAQGSVTQPNGPGGSGSLNVATTETATALAGRTAGVLALRDGLYAACQSYVNGVLGHDAYAIVLSQYGNLLVALTGNQTAGSPATYTAQESAIAAMLVACISEHDPTRIRPMTARGKPDTNKLLSLAGCRKLLDAIASGRVLAPPKKAATTKTPTKKEASLNPGEKVVTKTVMEKSGPPIQAVPVSAKSGG